MWHSSRVSGTQPRWAASGDVQIRRTMVERGGDGSMGRDPTGKSATEAPLIPTSTGEIRKHCVEGPSLHETRDVAAIEGASETWMT